MNEPPVQSRGLLKLQIAGCLVAGPGQLVLAAFILASGEQTRGLITLALGVVMTALLANAVHQWRKLPAEVGR